jgi:hypothetical protein
LAEGINDADILASQNKVKCRLRFLKGWVFSASDCWQISLGETMKQKIIATTFLFILLSAACKTGDPIIGRWKPTDKDPEPVPLQEDPRHIEFRPDGRYVLSFLTGGTWRRLDNSRVEMTSDPLGPIERRTRIVTVKIDGDVLTITEPDGKSTKFKR